MRTRVLTVGIAVSKKCDAVVGTIVSGRPIGPSLEQAALAHDNTAMVSRWAAVSLGLP